MKASEILGSLPNWANATASEIVHSSAWAMPCRLGDAVCAMRHSEFDLADTLDVSILLEDEPHVLSLADSPAFEELH